MKRQACHRILIGADRLLRGCRGGPDAALHRGNASNLPGAAAQCLRFRSSCAGLLLRVLCANPDINRGVSCDREKEADAADYGRQRPFGETLAPAEVSSGPKRQRGQQAFWSIRSDGNPVDLFHLCGGFFHGMDARRGGVSVPFRVFCN